MVQHHAPIRLFTIFENDYCIWNDLKGIRVDDNNGAVLAVSVFHHVGRTAFRRSYVDGNHKRRMGDDPVGTLKHTVSFV